MTRQAIPEPQSAADVLMIRPVRFAGNPQTSASNRFQLTTSSAADEVQAAALREFDAIVRSLREAGVNVHVFEDTPDPHTPDSIFPNNWVSFHADGTVVLYPMLAENRRLERRPDLLNELSARHGFRVAQLIDLTQHEQQGKVLEGTGSLVLDRAERVAVVDALRTTGHEIVDLSMEQLAAFAGNMLELRTPASGSVVAMSARAHDSLTAQQRRVIEARGGPIVATPIPTIETLGGGSVRCMLAEIHLPKKK